MQIYNTMSRKKEEFVPLKDKKVNIYTCGPTVYDFFHVGNARVFITFDMVRNYLRFRGYDATLVQNFTDIDDKMIKRAGEEGITVKELGERFIDEYFKDAGALGVKPADIHPRATEHIGDIIDIVKTLAEKGFAYEADGDVYFETKKFPDYGKLSHQNLDELEAGARVDTGEKKRDPMDFALWKAQKPGEPAWDSPWGKGRPGWHIECSAMAMSHLGETIDIHGGGPDLIFPHHENEIAQSEAATGKPFSRYFMHVGFLNIDNQKMSKSLGNFFTVRDILKSYEPEVLRFFMLSSHYRSPINFSRDLMHQAKSSLERLYNGLTNMRHLERTAPEKGASPRREEEYWERQKENEAGFIAAMDDDFNTAGALASLFDIVREYNVGIDEGSSRQIIAKTRELLLSLGEVLGFFSEFGKKEMLDEEIDHKIGEREAARKAKDFALADKIRDELKDKGIILEDTPTGIRWKRTK